MELGFVRQSMCCVHCGETMNLTKSKDLKNDGYNWRCINFLCIHYQTTRSIRSESWLEKLSICSQKILKILLYWSKNKSQKDISDFVSVSKNTLSKFRKFLLLKIKSHFINNPIKLGGPGVNVQVDETMLNYKVKSHRGRGPREQIWCLSIVDTSFLPSRGYYEIVANRRAETLLPIIARVVREGSIISTDEFSSYIRLRDNANYEHRTVCHKYNFVCPITGVHTQHVESNNNKLKRGIKSANGLTSEGRNLYLIEFMFLDYYKNESYNIICNLLNINL